MTPEPDGSNIIVKDYIWDGNYIFGTFYDVKDNIDRFILDDGDIYTIQDLLDEGYQVLRLHSNEIIEAFKGRFK